GEINQVFLNIIINAAQAIAEGHGETEEISDAITIRTKARNDCIEIEIADTGSGIPESILEKIFDPFFTTKEVGKGTGQGLAIAHSVIVDKHHGTISCRSEVGKGTTFTISLPLESELAAVGDMK
ncbi:MAG: histidine kinase, partial [Candidatus Hydrogenedentes bacterium]|nr:histidine kinase [Candidatus Hydrogenedentota bacterium]